MWARRTIPSCSGPTTFELLGILTETAQNAPSRAFLTERGEGLERVAFTTTDAAEGVEEIRARGLAGVGPIDFGRPVKLPGGGESEARFRVFCWPLDETPGGVRLFACQHLTREAVWIPSLQQHKNTATRLARVEVVTGDPRGGAEHLARLIDGKPEGGKDGSWRVRTGGTRADLVFLDRLTLSARYPGVSLGGLTEEGGAALVVTVGDLDAAARALGLQGVRTERAVCVAPAAANGLIVAFEQG